MNINVTTDTPGRGRPRTFNEDKVLDALTDLFWDKGYEATSMADILQVSGLRKSSLYNTFGSKRDLFRRILDRYVETRMEGFAEMAAASERPGLGALHDFLDAVFAFGRAGCLAVNTTTEFGTSDPAVSALARVYRDRIRAALHRVVTAATRSDEAPPELAEVRTEMLLGFLLGYAVAARTGADEAEMQRLAAAAHATVEGWAV
ncbi:MAG: TetR/AcrR family transcriptional regulator [Rhodobacter sp.]|nr:TetR/AcrR family transcriptional regulator [Rhodobacter sp.]